MPQMHTRRSMQQWNMPKKTSSASQRRLKNHRGASTNQENDVDVAPMAVYAGAAQLPDSISDDDDLLPVVAELSYSIEVLTVEQAVMRLELGGLTMLMFRNAGHFWLERCSSS